MCASFGASKSKVACGSKAGSPKEDEGAYVASARGCMLTDIPRRPSCESEEGDFMYCAGYVEGTLGYLSMSLWSWYQAAGNLHWPTVR